MSRPLFLLIVASFLFLPSKNIDIDAKSETVRWEDPINLSNTITSSAQPTIATDRFGFVHVIWSEDIDGPPISNQSPIAGKALYYTRWDGREWSVPIDIIWTSLRASYPSAVVDSDGILHLIWVEFDGIYYSHAPAWSSTQVKNWIAPTKIITAGYIGTPPEIFVDDTGGLHIMYADWGDGINPTNGNVYYTNSVDGGKDWSDPIQISAIQDGKELATQPRAVVDEHNVVHVVWSQMSPLMRQLSIYYTRQEYEQNIFLAPTEVAQAGPDDTWMTAANIAVTNEEVHITWVCGEFPYRCHQWSPDGGVTWTSPNQVFGRLLSLANWDALAVDAGGNLYWVVQLRYPRAMYYSVWNGYSWDDPPVPFISDGPMKDGHAPDIAVGQGNLLHLVLVDQNNAEIYYVRGVTQATPILPLSTPVPLSGSTEISAPTAISKTESSTFSASSSSGLQPEMGEVPQVLPLEIGTASQRPLIFGLVPVIFFLCALVIVKSIVKRKSS